MKALDPRITPARPDVAAEHLKGQVKAARYAQGRLLQVTRGHIALAREPARDAPMETELRFGEGFTAYDEKDGWLWGQSAVDNYVGYAREDAFMSGDRPAPSHRVSSLATPLLPMPDVTQRAPRDLLPMNARVTVIGEEGKFARLAEGYVFSGHLVPLSHRETDWVSVAERYIGIPYVWGGLTVDGLDCSGLVQNALAAGGISALRDADMMESSLGRAVPVSPMLSGLARGDLIFWKGHVGVMLDAMNLLHANGFHMQVAKEPLRVAVARIQEMDGTPIRTIKRM